MSIMLDSYFQKQCQLAKIECNFRCPEDCNQPGCLLEDIIVEVTLFDLIRLSQALNYQVSNTFFNHCQLGIQDSEFNPRYKRLLVKLRKPCHFLEKTRCMVHSLKPLHCVLFPEYHQVQGLLSEIGRQPVFSKFPCLKDEIHISENRSKALKKLRRMSQRERVISHYLLFKDPCYLIDTKPFTKRLKKNNPKNRQLYIQDYDRYLIKALKSTGLFDSIMGEVYKLDTRPGKEQLFEKLEDHAFMNSILEKMVKPGVVYRLKGGQVKRLRRNIQKPEIVFM